MEKLTKSSFPQSKPLIIICGPTASGKTELAYLFHRVINSEIISADSRQVYKYLNIGTAKPVREELNQYPYHLIDFLEPTENYSAGQFAKDAGKIIEKLLTEDKVPIIVGGTGLYISALCDGILVTTNETSYYDLENFNKVRTLNNLELFELALRIDPDILSRYPDKNPRRLLRALEFYYQYGERLSEARARRTFKPNYNPLYFAVNHPREYLYNRINKRSLSMIKEGLVQEVRDLINIGFKPDLNSLNTVGYKEIIRFINNEITLEKAIEDIQKNTRHYAKRQLTWFRRNPEINWLDVDFLSEQNILKLIEDKYAKI